jgi:pimeloyl-ACP methyl ester carboxylesterase
MIDDEHGRIDYDEAGSGPTVVLVPGSWGTRSGWREVVAALDGRCRIVTTSLLGYGGTDERRTTGDNPIACEAEIVEAVIARAGCPVHLVGHSFGGAVCLAVAARKIATLPSLAVIEPTAFGVLKQSGESALYGQVTAMRDGYFRAVANGEKDAARRVIDFYGGKGSFDALPQRTREYVVATTPANVLDWRTGFDAPLPPFGDIAVPSLVVRGERGHPSMSRISEILAGTIPNASLTTVGGAGHFMIATHPGQVARLIGGAVSAARPWRAAARTHEDWSWEA